MILYIKHFLAYKKFFSKFKTMEKIYYYRVEGIKIEGKNAIIKGEGLPPFESSPPIEFGGPGGRWAPEYLFVASVVSCFIMTFISVANAMRIEFEEMKCEGVGTLKPTEGNKMEFVEVILKPTVVVRSEQLKEKTLKAIKVTHDHCLVARSLKSEVKVEPSVIIK
jgi:organic hydroperoxide reductase OsmC/OhrA